MVKMERIISVDEDVFVNPRADEIFGLVFLEVATCGTPVICSKGCGIADVIDGQIGLAVPYDKEQSRDAVLHMIGNDKLRREFGEKGKLLVHERFNWEKIAEQKKNVYQSVIQQRKELSTLKGGADGLQDSD